MGDLLLHSMKEFDEIIFEILTTVKPRSVLEIGSETGNFSKRLMSFCTETGAKIAVVEPYPAKELVALAEKQDDFHLFVGKSLAYLSEFGCPADFAFVDGDHNYYTVQNELEMIDRAWRASGTRGIMILHDVGFPSARRDSYCDPTGIPADARHPFSFDQGVGSIDASPLVRGGFRGDGHFAWALHQGGPKNGVLTAVEDFLLARPEYTFRTIDAVFGLGALTFKNSEGDRVVQKAFSRYDNALVKRLEKNRLELYLKVIELQDALQAKSVGAG